MEQFRKNYIDRKLGEVYAKSKTDTCFQIIENFDELIKEFDGDRLIENEDICYFYRKLFECVVAINKVDVVEKMEEKLVKNFNSRVPKDSKENPFFNPTIDVLILSALFFRDRADFIISDRLFEKAIKHGEKYLDDSKKNYHDSLLCAYAWMVSINYEDKDYKSCIKNAKRALELYESVKDLDGFYYKEYDPNVIYGYLLDAKAKLG